MAFASNSEDGKKIRKAKNAAEKKQKDSLRVGAMVVVIVNAFDQRAFEQKLPNVPHLTLFLMFYTTCILD